MASTTSQPSVLNSPALNNSNDANGGGVAGGSMQEPVQATTFVNSHGYGGGGPPLPSSLYGVPPNVNHPPGTSQESPSNPGVLNSLGSSVIPRPLVPSPSFSYKISPAGVGFPGEQQASGMNNTGEVAQENKDVSFAPSTSQSNVSLPLPTPSSSAVTGPLNSNIGSVTLSMHTVAPFQVAPGISGTPGTPGASAMVPFAPIPSNTTATSASMDFFSPVARPNVPNNALPNVALQPHAYPSVPPLVTSPQAPWLLPPQNNGLQRPPFLPYPAAFPSPFSQPAHAMPLSPVLLSSSLPPGVTSAMVPGETPMSFAASGNRLAVGFGFQQELPPGTDNKKQDVVTKDGAAVGKQDSWTAHRTETGVVYYYNALTGESTYEKPPGFKGETDKVTTQPTPVSCEKLAGTDWVLVTTNDGKKYYHNTKTKLSSWQIPNEVADLKMKQDVVKDQAMSVTNTNTSYDKGSGPVSLSAPAVNTGGRDAITLRASSVPGSSSALDLIKRKLQESGDPATSSSILALSGTAALDVSGPVTIETTVSGPHSENSKDANGDANPSDSSSDSEDVNSGPTKEERVMQFKEMLKERGVAPFSKWEKELPKIVFDTRFKAIPSYSARKALFEHYVRTRAEEQRKEKRAAQKAAIEGFKQLLEEAKEDIDHNTDYPTFKKIWSHDPRFEALDRKEREVLLNERVVPLKKAAEERAQAVRAAAASSFKSMLLERGDIDANSRWSKVKDSLRNDSRYKSVKHEDRETLFNEYMLELKAAEEETKRVAKAKWDEEEKLKERERELRKRKEREEQEVERVRSKARRKEAVESYQALLVETIKDSQASWTESKTKLEKDPQERAANPFLDQSDLEKLFREHVKVLNERCAQEFRALLSEVVTAEAATEEKEDGKTVLNSWSTAKRLLKADPRYTKVPRKERESLWRRHVEDVQRRQRRHELGSDREAEKRRDGRGRNSIESGKYLSGSRY